MSGRQRTTSLILLCAVLLVFWALCRLLPASTNPPATSTSTAFVLFTPTSTSTSRLSPLATVTAVVSPTPTPEDSATPIPQATDTAPSSPTPTTPSPTASATPTEAPSPTGTAVPRPTVATEVMEYLEEFVTLVVQVHDMRLLGAATQIDESTADQLRGVYDRLHEMAVPDGAEEMHVSFTIYVSVLEEKCLCHIFAEVHSGDAQGEHYRQCENRATNTAMDLLSNRFIPSREEFLQAHGLSALEVGFPY